MVLTKEVVAFVHSVHQELAVNLDSVAFHAVTVIVTEFDLTTKITVYNMLYFKKSFIIINI